VTGVALRINTGNVHVAVIAIGCICIGVTGEGVSRGVVAECAVMVADDVSPMTEVTCIRISAVTGDIQ
jgi:hypothetical protein